MRGAEAGGPRAYPAKDWSVADFVGKYHSSKIGNKLAPIPGTQLALEKAHEDALKEFHDKKDCDKAERDKRVALKLHVKQQSAQLNTMVHFDTVFGQNLNKIEAVLNESERLLCAEAMEFPDEPAAIAKFQRNVEDGSHFYVGYAVSNGFQSINFQDPQSGNSFLHLAVRRGHVQVVEELLKYKANPDVKNRLGAYPVHEAWLFWKTHKMRTKEERLEQEAKTCQILLHLFSYGAFVDACDMNDQTPLHVACRLGPVKAVKIILTFQCDVDRETKDGLSAQALAQEFEQPETLRLLLAWAGIRGYLLQSDFHTVWHKFLTDYESSMQLSKAAETIIGELDLERNARHMARAGKESMVFVDDPLLLQALQASKNSIGGAQAQAPKPWERDWKRYVKLSKAAGVVDLKTKLDSLKDRAKKGGGGGGGGRAKSPRKRTGMNEADRRRSNLPDRPTPLTWAEQEAARRTRADQVRQADAESQEGSGDDYDHEGEGEGVPSAALQSLSSAQSSSNLSAASGGSAPSLFSMSHFSTPMHAESALHQRRQHFAQKVALDAKFLRFTKRLTQQSALSLPLRTPAAPMDGTEEQRSIMRRILAQGFEFDRLEKYKQQENSQLAALLGTQRSPERDKLGAYSQEVQCSKLNARDELYDRLFLAAQAAAAEAGTEEEKEELQALFAPVDEQRARRPAGKLEAEKRAKIDLVGDSRPRYVDKALLPVKEEATVVEKMIRDHKAKEQAEKLRRQGLGTEAGREAARLEMEQSIANAHTSLEHQAINDGHDKTAIAMMAQENQFLRTASRQRQRSNAEKAQAISRLFLQKEEVKYGHGRLTSSHNLKGRIEEPWGTVGGRYATVAGDRTA